MRLLRYNDLDVTGLSAHVDRAEQFLEKGDFRSADALNRSLAADATSFRLLDAPVQALAPTGMLLALLAQGSTLPIATADTAWVIRSAGDTLDWSRLNELARRHRLLPAVQKSLLRMCAIPTIFSASMLATLSAQKSSP